MRFPASARTTANMPRTNRHLVKRFKALPEKKTPLRLVPATALKAYMKPVSFPRTIARCGTARQILSRGTSRGCWHERSDPPSDAFRAVALPGHPRGARGALSQGTGERGPGLCGHPSLTGLNSGTGTSGSTAWNNSVRSRLYLSRITDNGFEPDPDARVLSTKKANYGRTVGEINLKWEAGVFVAEAQPTGLDALAAGAKGERVFLKLLDTLTAQGRYVSASPGPTYAPTQFASHPEAEGCTKRALKSAMDALFGRGEIVIASHGSGAKARSHIARKGADDGQE